MNTGIQRVVRNIVEGIPKNINKRPVVFVPVVAVGTRFYKIKNATINRSVLMKLVVGILGFVRNTLNLIFMNKFGSHFSEVDVLSNGASSDDIYSKIVCYCRKLIPYIFKLAYIADGTIDKKPVNFRQNDILFFADAFWKPDVMGALDELGKSKIIKILLVYDVIAARYKGVFDEIYAKNFMLCLKHFAEKIDGIITISKSSLEEIKNCKELIPPGIHFDFFHLGADFSRCAKIAGNVRHQVSEIFAESPVYLMVGTIEPRKNHSFVLNAFDWLWKEGLPTRLCIVGKQGWMCEEVIRRIKNSVYHGSKLYHFSDLNDDELEYCYKNSKALVIASIAEGFGLPLVEAMHHGKPVIASDIPVFREIGEGYPIYFDLNDSRSLACKIRDYENNILVKQFESKKWLSWNESIDDLFVKVVDMAQKVCAE